MPLPIPDLDDRTFDDLVEAARQQIAQTTQGEWTGASPGDPGVVLLELYAFLTETMIYRLNRLPNKVYVALLNLLGVALRPPSAASVTLQFSLDRPSAQAVTIPRGTAVESAQRDASGQPVVFRTVQQVVIPAGQTGARVLAYHYQPVEGELLGLGAGMAGMTFKVAAPPIINPPGELDNTLIVGVEARPNQPPNGLPERAHQGKTYQLWRQVDNFTDLLTYPYAYVVDRMSGAITFAPAQGWENGVPPVVPAKGKKILAWYWYRGSQFTGSYGEVNGDLLGTGSGEPGLAFALPGQAIISQTLALAVQAEPGEKVEPGALRVVAGETYRVWSEVNDLAQLHPSPYVFRLDRDGRTVRFADPDELDQAQARAEQRRAHIPPAGQEIRAWYWSGGGTGVPGGASGSTGNVPAGSLTTLQSTIPGVRLTVTNPGPASGGYDAETLAEALQRGPQELYTLPRGAITARDFERLALRSSPAIARAQALTKAELWKQARPGTVEVLLVPDLPGIPKTQRGSGQITAQALDEQGKSDSTALDTCRASLDARRPLGTHCAVNWTSYKTVRIKARIFVRQEENAVAVRERVLRRLHEHINPLPTAAGPGWPFGKPLQASDVYNIALAEPGVRWVDQVGLVLDEVPEKNVCSLAADCFEPGAWYASSGGILFRSRNDGEGWEPAGRFPGQTIRLVRSHPRKPGHVVALARSDRDGEMRLHLSRSYGETWEEGDVFTPRFETGEAILDVNDLVWSLGDPPAVLVATERGLYRVELNNAEPGQPVLLEPPAGSGGPPARRPVYAVATARTAVASTDTIWVAAVTQDGVYVSDDGGIRFERRVAGLLGEDIQKLAFQEDNGVYLWAGTAAAGGQEGQGCLRLRLGTGAAEKWVSFGPGQGWRGGSCNNLAFWGPWVLAATHHQGVLMLDTSAAVWANQEAPDPAAGKGGHARREAAATAAGQSGLPRWKVPDVETCGLPPRGEPGPFQPVAALATNWSPDSPPAQPVILAGIVREIEREAGEGVYRSLNRGDTYEFLSRHVFEERVTLPPTWLFVSGSHEVTVAYEGQEGL